MTRTDIINSLIEKFGYKSYLEIGVEEGLNFKEINCPFKASVDPDIEIKANADYKITSDNFFIINDKYYDCIFIDGLHHAKQVCKDILNSMTILNKGGTIIVHDCNPYNHEAQVVPRQQDVWNGDVWKAWVGLRKVMLDVEMFCVDTDHGTGIIRKGSQEKLILKDEVTYENLITNKKEWLNLISVEQFQKWLNK